MLSLHPHCRCRLDKASPRWRNVPAPARGAQVSVMGPIFDVLPNGRVVIDILMIGFGTSTPLTYPPHLSAPNAPDGKKRKFMARAPARPDQTPPDATGSSTNASSSKASSSKLILALDAANSLRCVFSVVFRFCFELSFYHSSQPSLPDGHLCPKKRLTATCYGSLV